MSQIEMQARPIRRAAMVDIVVPVYNESGELERSVRRLRRYLDSDFPFTSVITIVDNASTDRTWDIALHLMEAMPGVRAVHLDAKGRGRALRSAWTGSDAEVVAYMDVDLSTELDALLPLIAPLISGHSDVAIGSRLSRGSRVIRGPRRELISRTYNLLLRLVLRSRFSDAQCGFKALRTEDARLLLPSVVDDEWFFDTELLVLAERNGLRIHEVPVDWSDDPDSRVDVTRTAIADLKGVWRLLREISSGGGRVDRLDARRPPVDAAEATRFAGIGMLSTLAYLVLFLVLRSQMNAYSANLVSLSACSALNMAAHLRYTFAGHGPFSRWTNLAGTGLTLGTSLLLTTVCLAIGRDLGHGSVTTEVAALLAGNAVAAFARFVIIRALVFRAYLRRTGQEAPVGPLRRAT